MWIKGPCEQFSSSQKIGSGCGLDRVCFGLLVHLGASRCPKENIVLWAPQKNGAPGTQQGTVGRVLRNVWANTAVFELEYINNVHLNDLFFTWVYQNTVQTSVVSSLCWWGNWGMRRLRDWPKVTKWVVDLWKRKLFPIHTADTVWRCQSKLRACSLFPDGSVLSFWDLSKGEKVVQVPQLVQSLVSWQSFQQADKLAAKKYDRWYFLWHQPRTEAGSDSSPQAALWGASRWAVCSECGKWPLPC